LSFKKILIINTYGIGDVLFTTPLIRNLRLAFPGAQIAYLANARTADLIEANQDIAQVFVYERDEFAAAYRRNPIVFFQKALALFNRIKGESFDAVFDFSLNSSFGFLSAACGIKKRIGFDYRKRGAYLTDRIPLSGFEDKHVVEYYLDLLRRVDVPIATRQMKLDIPPEDIRWAAEWLKGQKIDPARPLIAVLPGGGASWGKAAGHKRWPAPNYAHLIDKIVENLDAAIILMGDSKEEELCREVANLARHPLHYAVGQTSLLGLAALLKHCRGAVLNDGGPLHVAAAVGVRTVSIFGPVDPQVYGPYPPANHTVLQKRLSCQPCYRRFRMADCSHLSCLMGLSVEDVYGQIDHFLSEVQDRKV
jgi:lipopolysaccharide heptosyltransferase II